VVGAGKLRLGLGVLCAGLLRPGRVLPGFGGPGLGLSRPGLRGGDRIVPLLAGLRHLLLRSLAGPVQLRAVRFGCLPRPGRIPPGIRRPGLSLSRPGVCVGHRIVPLLPRRGHLLLRDPLGLGGPRLCRLTRSRGLRYSFGPPRLGLRCCGTRLPGLLLSPLAAPPEREPRRVWITRPGRPATLPGQHLAPPERGQRRVRLPGHRVRQPAIPKLRRPWPRLILTTRIRAPGDFLSGLSHLNAPFCLTSKA
jgi:hypothetical protein